MKSIHELQKIKDLYLQGGNIVEYIKNQTGEVLNSREALMISYDLRAGTYIEYAKENKEYIDLYTTAICKVLKNLTQFDSLIEVGVGEATTMANVLQRLGKQPKQSYGFDISWSRIKYAREYLSSLSLNNTDLFVGDIYNCPFLDSSIDIVYTSHSIYANGGKEKESLEELYRITKKYLVLLEPAYEFANEEAKKRMKRLNYVTKLASTAKELGYKIREHRMFDHHSNPLNPTGLLIIEKEPNTKSENICFACPISKTSLELKGDCYYSKESLLAYPIIGGIPCLLPDNAVVATHLI